MDSAERCHTCHRHDVMVERMATVEAKLVDLQRLVVELKEMEQWIKEDAQKSHWFYANESSIKQVVAASRWAIAARSVAAWIMGLVIAVGTTLAWLKENISHFFK